MHVTAYFSKKYHKKNKPEINDNVPTEGKWKSGRKESRDSVTFLSKFLCVVLTFGTIVMFLHIKKIKSTSYQEN